MACHGAVDVVCMRIVLWKSVKLAGIKMKGMPITNRALKTIK